MLTPDYSIISPNMDALAALQCRLLIKVNEQFLHYIIVYGNNTIAALKYYQFTQAGGKTIAEWLEELLTGDEPPSKKNGRKNRLISFYAVPENQLPSLKTLF